MSRIVDRIARRHLEQKKATSEAQWEMADELLNQGLKHPLFRRYNKALAAFEKSLNEAKKRNEGYKRGPVGRTAAPDLLESCIRELEDVAEESTKLAKGIPAELAKNVTNW